jgi:radical SAM protein with 4Fe4S-binding SPASM domain
MHCLHCGSTCGAPLPNELTTAEALQLCDELAELGVQFITLSGGEPFLRADWHLLAERLTANGIRTNIITNGWFINDALLDKALAAGITNICLSLDGSQAAHDALRKSGSFQHVIAALKLLVKRKIPAACVTSIHKKNLAELPRIKQILLEHGVQQWQIQLALPMGNMLEHPDLVIVARDIPAIIDFCHATNDEGKIIIHLGDNLGYYSTRNEEIIRRCAGDNEDIYLNFTWRGCHAGKRIIGVRADGSIGGCLAIRDEKYLVGNVRTIPLKELWCNPQSFVWNRNFKKEELQGFCRKCLHGSVCFGGCSAQKLSLCGSLYAANSICLYRLEIEEQTRDVEEITDYAQLVAKVKQNFVDGKYQVAEIYLSKALQQKPTDPTLNKYAGLIHYFLGNYLDALQFCELVLKDSPDDYEALQYKGLSFYKLGRVDDAIKTIKEAMYFIIDKESYCVVGTKLVQIFIEQRQLQQAFELLRFCRTLSRSFRKSSQKMYDQLRSLLGVK